MSDQNDAKSTNKVRDLRTKLIWPISPVYN